MKAICTVPDCFKPVMAKGWCNRHYYRLRLAPPCGVSDCEKPSTTKGMCDQHYARFKRHGDPMAGRVERGETQRWITRNAQYDGDACLIWPFARSSVGYGVTWTGGKYALAHRVMCEVAHGPAPTPRHQAAHSCGNGHLGCTSPAHLRWATTSENALEAVAHGTKYTMLKGEEHKMAKLSDDDVLAIRRRFGEGASKAELSRAFSVSPSNIFRIVNRQSWAHIA